MKKAIRLTGILAIVMMINYDAKEKKTPGSYEIEKFELRNAEIKDNATANGGKTVLLLEGGTAKKTIKLKKGIYNVTVYAQGASKAEDAFNLSIGDQITDLRSYQNEDNEKVLPTLQSPVQYTQEEDGVCKIVISYSDEDNVQVDRIVFILQE